MIFFTIFDILLMFTAMAGFILTVFGTPAGITLLIIYLISLKRKKNIKLLKWGFILLSGIPLLVITFVLYALLHMAAAYFKVTLGLNGPMPFAIY